MIELQRHIEILLLSNDCVIVPDFGGFMAHHVDARYDESDGSFLPPLRTIGFNPQLRLNDSLLAQSYVEAYDISYPEALRRIGDEVNELRQHLDNDGMYELADLGVLSLNEAGRLVFEPCEAGLLTPEYYGLSNFEIPLLKDVPQVVEVKTGDAVAAGHPKDKQKEKRRAVPTLQKVMGGDASGERRISIKVGVLQNALAAAIVIVAFLLFPVRLGNQDALTSQKSGVDTGLLMKVMPKTDTKVSTALTGSSAKPVAAATQKAAVASTTSEKVKEATPHNYYTLVLASRVTKRNAALFVSDLHRQGLEAAFVLPRDRGAKVIYGRYGSEEEARRALRLMQGKEHFKEAWIMRVAKD